MAYHRCSVYLYVMLCQVALHCLVLRISVPSLTLCCSVHLTIEDLKLETNTHTYIGLNTVNTLIKGLVFFGRG